VEIDDHRTLDAELGPELGRGRDVVVHAVGADEAVAIRRLIARHGGDRPSPV